MGIMDNVVNVQDRQQEVCPVLVALRYNGDYITPVGSNICIIYILLAYFILFYGRFLYIKYVKITLTDTIWA